MSTIKTVRIRNVIPWSSGRAYDYNHCEIGDIVMTETDLKSMHICISKEHGLTTFLAISEKEIKRVKNGPLVFDVLNNCHNKPEYHHRRLIQAMPGIEAIDFSYQEEYRHDDTVVCVPLEFSGINAASRRHKIDTQAYKKMKEFGVF